MTGVSVLMPIYNTPSVYIEQAIASLIGQEFCDWELVIVEDPSEKQAADIVRAFADDRIRYFRNPKRTCLVDQRNAAYQISRYEYLAMLDSDDICEASRLKQQLEFLESHDDIGVIGCQLRLMDDSGFVFAERRYPQTHGEIERRMKRSNPLPQPGVMMRRSAMEAVGGYQYRRFIGLEDYDLWCRLLKKGVRFANHPQCLLRYRMHGSQLKQDKLREQLLGTVDIKRTHFQGEMTIGDLGRLHLERLLVFMPASLVLFLFKTLTFKRVVPT